MPQWRKTYCWARAVVGMGGLVAGRRRRVVIREGGSVLLDDVLYGLFEPTLAKVCVVLCPDSFSPALNLGVDFLLEDSLIACHLPLPAVGKVAGVGLWE